MPLAIAAARVPLAIAATESHIVQARLAAEMTKFMKDQSQAKNMRNSDITELPKQPGVFNLAAAASLNLSRDANCIVSSQESTAPRTN